MKNSFPSRFRAVRSALTLATLLFLQNQCALAQLIIGNLSTGANPPGGMQVGQFNLAVEFAVGPTDLTAGSVDLELAYFDPKNFAVAIQYDNGGSPFGGVGSFSAPLTGGAGPAVFTFIAATPVVLKANQYYWLVVTADPANPTTWDRDNRTMMAGSAQYLNTKYFDPVRGSWCDIDAPLFNINSTTIGTGPGGGNGGGGGTNPPPQFTSYKLNPNGSFHLTLTGQPNITCTLLTSRNLALGWTTLATLTSTNGIIDYDDTQASGAGQTFYEVQTGP